MTWTKLGDEFADECWPLDDRLFRLHVHALIWSNRRHLDGRLPKGELLRWAHDMDAVESAGTLVAIGYWTEDDEAYLIKHHQGVQMTAAQHRKRTEANQNNGRKGGQAKARNRSAAKSSSESSSESLSEWPSESSSERDRSGQVRNSPTKVSEKTKPGQENVRNWGTSLGEGTDRQTSPRPGPCNRCGSQPAAGDPLDPAACRGCVEAMKADVAELDAESA